MKTELEVNSPYPEEVEKPYWLSYILDPQTLPDSKKKHWSPERAVVEKLFEAWIELEESPKIYEELPDRVGTLFAVTREIVAYNTTDKFEREYFGKWRHDAKVDLKALRSRIDDNVIADLRWMWLTFQLTPPTNPMRRLDDKGPIIQSALQEPTTSK